MSCTTCSVRYHLDEIWTIVCCSYKLCSTLLHFYNYCVATILSLLYLIPTANSVNPVINSLRQIQLFIEHFWNSQICFWHSWKCFNDDEIIFYKKKKIHTSILLITLASEYYVISNNVDILYNALLVCDYLSLIRMIKPGKFYRKKKKK